MKIPFGYSIGNNQEISINHEQAQIVKQIYELYLQGKSLGGIAECLQEKQILSPSGNETWSRAAIDKILSNKKYIPTIIPFEKYVAVQFEKDKRSNVQDNNVRKTARYNSQNVLSGLLVCGECGKGYRRITRPSGEVVWRCANRVENGSAYCKESPTISDAEIKAFITETLRMPDFNESIVKNNIESILIDHHGNFDVELKENDSISLHL